MFPHKIDETGHFVVDDVEFRVSMATPDKRPRSEPGKFTIVKGKPMLDIYGMLSRTYKARTILELGVFQGGSYVLLDKLFGPERMSAVEIADTPVGALVDYCAATPGRSVHFKTSQADEARLKDIVATDLGGALDLVIDDASHMYDLTRRSFEILYPLLSPGGIYVIEDWGWSHMAPYQEPGAPWRQRPALTNFIFDLVALHGSTTYIAEIRVLKPLVIVRKPRIDIKTPENFMSAMKLRGRQLEPSL